MNIRHEASEAGGHAIGLRQSPAKQPFRVVLAGSALSLLLFAVSAPAGSETFIFDQYELNIGTSKRQTVLSGFLFDSTTANLLVVNVEPRDNRQLRVYSLLEEKWSETLQTTLGQDTLFVDVAEIGGRDRLITYQPGRLNWFDPNSGTEKELVEVSSSFKTPRRNEVPHVDVTQDVNRDGRVDLVVPDTDGFWVFVQTSGGTFGDPVKVEHATNMIGIYGADGYRYDPWSQSRIFEVDFNQDGRSDLVYWHEGRFRVHAQDTRGLFAQETATFATDVGFDSDDFYSLAQGAMQGKVLHSLADLTGDDVPDLILYSLTGKQKSKKRSAIHLHLGKPAPGGGTAFSTASELTFQADGVVQISIDIRDFNRDDCADILITSIDRRFLGRTLWKELKGAMGDDVLLNLEFYVSENGRYLKEPTTTRIRVLDGVPSHREPGWAPLDLLLRGATHESRRQKNRWPRSFNATMLFGDLTGDGIGDLLTADHPRHMNIHAGVRRRELFTSQPQTLNIPAPNDAEYIWLSDVNRDGKQDIIMHHRFTSRDIHGAPKMPEGSEPQRVVAIITK